VTVPPTFFVGGKEDGGDPVGVVVVLGDRMVRVGNCWCKDPLDPENALQIPGVELVPLREPGEPGKPVPREATSSHSPLVVLAFRNPGAIATFMEALDRVEKKLTGETPKFVVQFDPAPRYPRVEVPTEAGWYWRQHRLWEVAPSSNRLVFLHGGVVRSVEDVSGPWFGPVPPPEDWK
jgi:hypothetical protein